MVPLIRSPLFLVFIFLLGAEVARSQSESNRQNVNKTATKTAQRVKIGKRRPIDSGINNYVEALKEAMEDEKYLEARVLIKKIARRPLNYQSWGQVRNLIFTGPEVGYDLIFKWDRLGLKYKKLNRVENKINRIVIRADLLMLKKKFEKAFKYYQIVAKFLKAKYEGGQKESRLLYLHTIHSMARALYGAKRYKDSLEVYEWLPKFYVRYRQSLFEKMWAAFRAGRIDLANGTIASLRSSYFSDYVEPETYLIQFYIYKKLCREEEQKKLRGLIKRFRKKLLVDGKSKDFVPWANSEIESKSLLLLSQTKVEDDDSRLVLRSELELEKKKIARVLEKRFQSVRRRLLKQLEQVLAYSYIAIAADKIEMKTEALPSRSELLNLGKELWRVDDAEDWIDELGGHLYVGETQCTDGNT